MLGLLLLALGEGARRVWEMEGPGRRRRRIVLEGFMVAKKGGAMVGIVGFLSLLVAFGLGNVVEDGERLVRVVFVHTYFSVAAVLSVRYPASHQTVSLSASICPLLAIMDSERQRFGPTKCVIHMKVVFRLSPRTVRQPIPRNSLHGTPWLTFH